MSYTTCKAWDKKRKKWADWVEVYGDGSFNIDYLLEGGGLIKANWKDADEFGVDFDCSKDAVLVYSTGIYDRNKREVFEGDIIEVLKKHEYMCNMCNGNRLFINDVFDFYSWDGDHDGCVSDAVKAGAVIGNIYEHPELLK